MIEGCKTLWPKYLDVWKFEVMESERTPWAEYACSRQSLNDRQKADDSREASNAVFTAYLSNNAGRYAHYPWNDRTSSLVKQ